MIFIAYALTSDDFTALAKSYGRLGGRIYPLPAEEFGYEAEGGPEFPIKNA